jgi:type I restriction enzyme, R subunit
MLDTGIDVPEVLNLVFFKPVYSRVKFNQMIGRGTRLCPDLFALGQDKTEFLIFDLCGNCEFFEQDIPEPDAKPTPNLTTRLLTARLALSQILPQNSPRPIVSEATGTYGTKIAPLQQTLLDQLHQHIASMPADNFLVRRHRRLIETFAQRDRWNHLTPEDQTTIINTLAPLPHGLPTEKREAKEFDLLCTNLQIAILQKSPNFIRLRDQVRDLMHSLEAKQTVPMVKTKLALIETVQTEDWWQDSTPDMVEIVRLELRDLIHFIDRPEREIHYTDFTDTLDPLTEITVPTIQTGFSPYQYRKKVETYIRDNENHIAIAKLKRNLPLTPDDLQSLETMLYDADAIGSRAQFESVFGRNDSLALFIRKLVGLDRAAAKTAFAQYLEASTFNANQIRFIETIIDYLTQQGIMDPGLLYEPPFTDLHDAGLDGIFPETEADRIIAIVRSFNQSVGATFNIA